MRDEAVLSEVPRRRRFACLALLAVAACGETGADEGAEPRKIEGLRARSEATACVPLAAFPENGAVVEDVHVVSDSTFLVLLPLERRVRVYDHAARPVFDLGFEADGPLGVRTPRSAALVDDTLVYVTDLGARRVRILSRTGHDRGTLGVGFAPDRIRSGPSGVWLTAFPIPGGGELVHLLRDGKFRPVGFPMRRHEDPRIEALGNLLELTVLPDGAVVAAHQVLVSRAAVFRARTDGGFDVVETTVPIASSERDRLGEVPPDLFEAENVRDLAAPVLAASFDPVSGEYLYLTRSGGTLAGGGTEKAIVRARADLSFVASRLLDVNAQDFVYLPRIRAFLVVDQDATWHRCDIPR